MQSPLVASSYSKILSRVRGMFDSIRITGSVYTNSNFVRRKRTKTSKTSWGNRCYIDNITRCQWVTNQCSSLHQLSYMWFPISCKAFHETLFVTEPCGPVHIFESSRPVRFCLYQTRTAPHRHRTIKNQIRIAPYYTCLLYTSPSPRD